ICITDLDNHNIHSFPTRRSSDLEPKFTYKFSEKEKKGLSLSENFSAKTVSPWKGVGRAINSSVVFNHQGYQYHVWQSFDRLDGRSEQHTSELQSRENLVCRLLLE